MRNRSSLTNNSSSRLSFRDRAAAARRMARSSGS
jgi:hypothetical protein